MIAIEITTVANILTTFSLGVIVIIPTLTNLFNWSKPVQPTTTLIGWVVLIGLFSFFPGIAYQFGPDRTARRWKWFTKGAIIAAVIWAIVSALFSCYVKEFANFNKTYGTLSSLIVLMTWLYLSNNFILLAGEINAALEIKQESTKGP